MSFKNDLGYEYSSVWLTGGLGFIGTRLTQHLLAKGALVTIFSSQKDLLSPTLTQLDKRLFKIAVDFESASHLDWLSLNLNFSKPTHIIMAGWTAVGDPNSILHHNSNVTSSTNFFNLVPKEKLQKTIFFGSIDEYGERLGLIKESDLPIPPISSYAIAKTKAARELSLLAKQFKTSMQHCLISNVYGPGQRGGTLLPQMKNSEQFIFQGESYYRDYIFIDDLRNIVLELLFVERNDDVNIGSGISTHCFDFARIAWAKMGKDPHKLSFVHPEVREESMMKCFNIAKLKELLPETLRFNGIGSGLTKTMLRS